MTERDKLLLVNSMYGKKADGTELTVGEITPFLIVAKSIILNRLYPFAKPTDELEMPMKYDILQCRIANFMLVKQGAEGEIQHTENGVTCIYGQDDIPKDLLNEIVPKVGIPG